MGLASAPSNIKGKGERLRKCNSPVQLFLQAWMEHTWWIYLISHYVSNVLAINSVKNVLKFRELNNVGRMLQLLPWLHHMDLPGNRILRYFSRFCLSSRHRSLQLPSMIQWKQCRKIAHKIGKKIIVAEYCNRSQSQLFMRWSERWPAGRSVYVMIIIKRRCHFMEIYSPLRLNKDSPKIPCGSTCPKTICDTRCTTTSYTGETIRN